MLKGRTTLKLSKKTMLAALDVYFAMTFKEKPAVLDVKMEDNYPSDTTFIVEIEEVDPDPNAVAKAS